MRSFLLKKEFISLLFLTKSLSVNAQDGFIHTINTMSGFAEDVMEKSDEKLTWDSALGMQGPGGDSDVRNKGYLDPGYWCDQRVFYDSGDEFYLDTTEFRHEVEIAGRRWTPIDRPVGAIDRIVGGENVQKNAWRWIGYFYGCGSTLIASDWALTAAHCCTIPAWYFRGKELCFGRDERDVEVHAEQCAGIAELIQHPEYDRSETVLNDICLIRLSRKLKYNDVVQPACLPKQGQSLGIDDIDNNVNCFVAGWGYREEGVQHSLPRILQDATANILTNDTCDNAYTIVSETGRVVHYFRPDEMSCFGHMDGKMDACQGDSGGPLVCLERSQTNEHRFNPVLRGVVSWGDGCARENKPGVYARISYYIDWLQTVIRDRAKTTNQHCAQPESLLKISANAIVDCSWEECAVKCKDAGYLPTHKTIKCFEAKRNYYPIKSGSRIECAPDPGIGNNLFTACGAITSFYDVDISKINIKCKKMKCSVSAKNKNMQPNVSTIKCLRGLRYSFEGKEIKLYPAGSVTKSCGPFYEKFPKALAAGIKARCTPNACYLTKPKAFKIVPYQKVACQKRMWQLAQEEITSDPDWKAFTFKEYNEFNVFGTNKNGEKLASLAISCGRMTIWDHIGGQVSPSFGPGRNAKPICETNKSATRMDCYFYCSGPTDDSDPVKINVKIQCKLKVGVWQPVSSKQLEKLTCP